MVAEKLGEATLAATFAAYESARAGPGLPPLLLDPGTEEDDLRGRLDLAARILAAGALGGCEDPAGGRLPPWLRLAAGIWPGRPALDHPEASVAALEESIAAEARRGFQVAAIGECGLDYHHHEAPEPVQRRLFALQCDLARRLGLPLIVHSREAFRDTLEVLLAEAAGLPTLIHCFGYGPEEARAFLDAGFSLSFAGNLTYKKAEALREALLLVPADRLLLETDAPYMNPEPRRGRPASPLDIGRTYAFAAALRGVALRSDGEDSLADTVSHNATRLFPPATPSS